MNYKLSQRSIDRMQGIHSDLAKVIYRAIEVTDLDFCVLEGVRSQERQKEMVRIGASKTMNSRHITGHAVDLGVWMDGEVRWDWPLYHRLGAIVKKAAEDVGITIVWGGDWDSFPDGPHFELSREVYS